MKKSVKKNNIFSPRNILIAFIVIIILLILNYSYPLFHLEELDLLQNKNYGDLFNDRDFPDNDGPTPADEPEPTPIDDGSPDMNDPRDTDGDGDYDCNDLSCDVRCQIPVCDGTAPPYCQNLDAINPTSCSYKIRISYILPPKVIVIPGQCIQGICIPEKSLVKPPRSDDID